MSETTEVILCAGGCGRSTTDPDLWDPCVETGKTYCDECWPYRTRPLGSIQFRITEIDETNLFDLYMRESERGSWSLAVHAADDAAIGAAVAEEIVYRRKVSR